MSTNSQVVANTAADSGILPDGGASPCVIKVIGVGGAGGNAVLRMIQTGVDGVGFSAINTDAQALAKFKGVASTLNIGRQVTRGLGAGKMQFIDDVIFMHLLDCNVFDHFSGGIPDNGRKAAEESRSEILGLVQGCDLVFVTAGIAISLLLL